MPEKPTSEAEAAFHSRRKAFVIFDAGILTAADGFAGSHFDLLVQTGMDGEQARRAIETCPRGYALDGDVFLYQGGGFFRAVGTGAAAGRTVRSFFQNERVAVPDGQGLRRDAPRRGRIGLDAVERILNITLT